METGALFLKWVIKDSAVNCFLPNPVFAPKVMINAVKVAAKQRRHKKHLMNLQGFRKVRAVVLNEIISKTYFIF